MLDCSPGAAFDAFLQVARAHQALLEDDLPAKGVDRRDVAATCDVLLKHMPPGRSEAAIELLKR